MAKKHMDRDMALFKMKTEAEAFMSTSRAVKMIALIVLHEKFHFGAKDLREFLERFEDVLDYYNKSHDYQELLHEWDDYFLEEIGERILWNGK